MKVESTRVSGRLTRWFFPTEVLELTLFILFLNCPSAWLHLQEDRSNLTVPHDALDEAEVDVLNTIHHIPIPEAFMSSPQLIQHNEYPVEEHFVITEDGYNLSMFRIPWGKRGKPAGGEPVIVQHGLLCSSDDWLLLMPNSGDNLPYVLADAGYDVWITNCRGNNYSMRHLTLSPDSRAFWNFSYVFHEMGIYDTPSFINYVLNATQKNEISYVGHSMGCSMFFIAMIRHPYLQEKVRKMVALAPAAYFKGTDSPLALVFALVPSPVLLTLYDFFKDGRIFSSGVNHWINDNGPSLCSGVIPAIMCMNLVFFIAGYDYKQANNLTASMIMGHTPSEASAKSLIHFIQLLRLGSFQEYDYGILGNLRNYGTMSPPKYNLTKNRVPTFIMWGQNDWLVKPANIAVDIQLLGNVTMHQSVDSRWFNHLDFTYAKDAKSLVYDHCLKYLAT